MDKTEARLTLAVDVMGSDQGPREIIEGVAHAVELSPRGTEFVLYGRQDVVEPILEDHPVLSNARVSISHAPEVVGMEEKPIAGIKGKKTLPCHSPFSRLRTGRPTPCSVAETPVA